MFLSTSMNKPYQGLILTVEQLQNLTLLEIEKLFEQNRRSLKDSLSLSYSNGYITKNQCKIFHIITQAVNYQQGRMFLYSYGGTDKIHMWRTLTYALSSQKRIVLTVTSSDRTTHSKFRIHVPSLENYVATFVKAPMTHKFFFEALDRSLANIMGTTINESILFGGNVMTNLASCSEGVLFSEEFVIIDFDNPIDTIVSSTYPNLQDHYNDE
ncbi:hypothetical protein Lal_00024056 [Lupinus albus]|nr:hypothetical protein Lal_00024056 [Lupinus albus]